MKVLQPGLLTTVQDLGRNGYQKVGVPVSGAMDALALRLGNALVANDVGGAGLEVTLRGPTLQFERDGLIAICGSSIDAQIADVAVPSWRAILVSRGCVLKLGKTTSGSRSYVAVAGGIDLPEVMGSRSTYLRAGIGGHEGRALRAGDRLPLGSPSSKARETMGRAGAHLGPLPFALSERATEPGSVEVYERRDEVRFVRGPHFELLDERDRDLLATQSFEVSTRSDRMGYRLKGAALASASGHDLISSAVVGGTVQVPPDGQPIVLMADCQTTGGYPMVANVITADLPCVAQLRPGDQIRLQEVALEEAQRLLRDRDRKVATIRKELEADGKGRP